MEKFVCIHGHFYQPPRENPWLESVELQDSAYPYHDWNERVSAECYAPNAAARLLGHDGRIQEIVNNYSRISFNIGPTLLAWMKEKTPDIHDAIVEADRISCERFSGHGSALAQAYNHLIMPLANKRDQRTQVLWCIKDFEFRFNRRPEGMWLPETAVDDDSLEALAEQGIRFTILSPYQASQIRRIGEEDWQAADNARVDPKRPYVVNLPSGRSIVVFFYDATVSQAVAFERLLNDGGLLARRLLDGLDPQREEAQLMHIATDGESYGHHHAHGEMALAYALHSIETEPGVKLTNYGEFLEKHPPTWEARVHQKSAWSCSHGVERWNSNCGCNSGGHPEWNQEWRAPLRGALDWLRDELIPRYEAKAHEFFRDPWLTRDEYIELILNRWPDHVMEFFNRHGTHPFNEGDHVAALQLLELQRHAMLMYTSCGWFFDEISGIETVQIIQYAARAIQLAQVLLGEDLESGFLERLANAKSNVSENENGRKIYDKFVRPAVIDREKVAAHYAVSSLFESYPEAARIYSFTIEQGDRQLYYAGQARLLIGWIKVRFEITHNSDVITYGVLHWGEHHLNCGVRHYQGPEAYLSLSQELKEAFDRADFAQIIRLMGSYFGESNYSLKSLFRDEQRKALSQILAVARDDVDKTMRLIADKYTPMLLFLADLQAPAPPALQMAVHFVLNNELRRLFEIDRIDFERARAVLAECTRDRVKLDEDSLAYTLKGHVDRISVQFTQNPTDLSLFDYFCKLAQFLRILPFEVNLWKTQNAYFAMTRSALPQSQSSEEAGDENAHKWVEQFKALGRDLGFAQPEPRLEPV